MEFRCAFFAADYTLTLEFYRDLLGLAVIESWDRGASDKGTIFAAASGMIEVLGIPEDDEDWVWDEKKPRGMLIVIEVADVGDLYERLGQRNLRFEQGLKLQKWGHLSFRIADPNGVMLYFFTKTDPGEPLADSL